MSLNTSPYEEDDDLCMKALPIALAILLAFSIIYLPHLFTSMLNVQSNQTISNNGTNFTITPIPLSQDNSYLTVPLVMFTTGFSVTLLAYLIIKKH